MTPFLEGIVVGDDKRKLFNKCICGSRSCIECVYGQLKRKFACLEKLRFYDMVKCSRLIEICAALLNFIHFHEPLDLYVEYCTQEALALYSEDYVYIDDSGVEEMPTNEKFFRHYFS